MIQKIKDSIYNNAEYIIAIVAIVVIALLVIGMCVSALDSNNDKESSVIKIATLEERYKTQQEQLNTQIRITDSLLKIVESKIPILMRDTITITKINTKYEKQKLDNRELSPTEQLQFSADWLSKEDNSGW